MTPEEYRWTRIENAMAFVTEHQAKFVEELEQQRQQAAAEFRQLRAVMSELATQAARTAAAAEITEQRLTKVIDRLDDLGQRDFGRQ